jgi:hypothetical protein
VHMLGACWRRPGLLLLELAWRWSFGIPALALLIYEAIHVLGPLPLRETGLYDLSLQNPLDAAQQVASAAALVLPHVVQVGRWLAPVLAVAWALASGLGRSLVLQRMDSSLHPARVTLILLQLLRFIALAAAFVAWWSALRWAASVTLSQRPPNLVGYSAWAICLSLAAFTAWALVSWIFSIAPLIAMLEGASVVGSLARSLRLGPLAGKLVEVNLVLSIVKLALIVLAMVFSSIPLPFTVSMSGPPLYLWWFAVSVFYFVASDFFQVARLAVFVKLWRVRQRVGESASRRVS